MDSATHYPIRRSKRPPKPANRRAESVRFIGPAECPPTVADRRSSRAVDLRSATEMAPARAAKSADPRRTRTANCRLPREAPRRLPPARFGFANPSPRARRSDAHASPDRHGPRTTRAEQRSDPRGDPAHRRGVDLPRRHLRVDVAGPPPTGGGCNPRLNLRARFCGASWHSTEGSVNSYFIVCASGKRQLQWEASTARACRAARGGCGRSIARHRSRPAANLNRARRLARRPESARPAKATHAV